VTSFTRRMSISLRLRNASSMAILVVDFMPFVFKFAILIEAIKSIVEGVWARGRRTRFYFYLAGLRYSRSAPLPFPYYFIVLFQIHLLSVWVLSGSFVVGTSPGCVVAPSAGTASSLCSPSALPTSVADSCLAPSSCVFACSCRAVCLVDLSSDAVISASTTNRCEGSIRSRGSVLVLGLQYVSS